MIAEGRKVRYIPHHDHHADAYVGKPIWEFVHQKDGRTGHPHAPSRHKAGDVADPTPAKVGTWHERDDDGNIVTAAGHVLKPSKPLRFWLATVIADNGDGTASLDIEHPHGHHLIYTKVIFDPAFDTLHSFHLAE